MILNTHLNYTFKPMPNYLNTPSILFMALQFNKADHRLPVAGESKCSLRTSSPAHCLNLPCLPRKHIKYPDGGLWSKPTEEGGGTQ